MPDEEEIKQHLIKIEAQNEALRRDLEKVDTKLTEYVTKVEFAPVKVIVFGMVGIAMTAMLVTWLLNIGLKVPQ